ncbi:MAG: phytanoyl-CoA dioxygenase family protein [Bacteroidetes bacterium]|nr:phytanoyl-CoA dioxygenase family protein [Bacteroidota bacterium]
MKDESYGVTKQNLVKDVVDEKLEEFFIRGFTVLENVLTNEELSETRKRLDDVYRKQVEEAAQNNFKLGDIREENVARMIFAYDDYFLNMVTNSAIIGYVKKIVGHYFILHLQNGIINMPDEKHHQSSWHRDLPYQDFVISKPLAVNALYCIDEFSKKTGGTLVVPFSHKMETIPSETYIEKHALQVEAPAGSVILMDSMVFHRAGYNSSTIIRRAVNHVYVAGILKQQMNIPSMLKGKFSDNPFLRMLLGYDSSEANSVSEYRLKRLKK